MRGLTKLLYVFVLAVVIVAVYLLFISSVNPKYDQVVDEGLESFVQSGKCFAFVSDTVCKGHRERGVCTDDPGCVWCSEEVNSQVVSTCLPVECGCDSQKYEISLSTDKSVYRPGETVTITGTVTFQGVRDLTGRVLDISILNSEQKAEDPISLGIKAEILDEKGSFEASYNIDIRAPDGDYYVLAVMEDDNKLDFGKAIKKYRVQK